MVILWDIGWPIAVGRKFDASILTNFEYFEDLNTNVLGTDRLRYDSVLLAVAYMQIKHKLRSYRAIEHCIPKQYHWT